MRSSCRNRWPSTVWLPDAVFKFITAAAARPVSSSRLLGRRTTSTYAPVYDSYQTRCCVDLSATETSSAISTSEQAGTGRDGWCVDRGCMSAYIYVPNTVGACRRSGVLRSPAVETRMLSLPSECHGRLHAQRHSAAVACAVSTTRVPSPCWRDAATCRRSAERSSDVRG